MDSRLGLLLLFGVAACSSAPVTEHRVHKLIPKNIHVRRPLTPSPLEVSKPGGGDYAASPLPNDRFDCEDIGWLFRELNLRAIRGCLASIAKARDTMDEKLVKAKMEEEKSEKEGKKVDPLEDKAEDWIVHYRLAREPAPYLYITDPKEVRHACLVRYLERIPVPREIVFQSTEEGNLRCFSARADLEANETLGLKLPSHRVAIKVTLPIKPVPEKDIDLIRMLAGWALTPLQAEGGSTEFISKIVPDVICERCMGKKKVIHESWELGPAPAGWP